MEKALNIGILSNIFRSALQGIDTRTWLGKYADPIFPLTLAIEVSD